MSERLHCRLGGWSSRVLLSLRNWPPVLRARDRRLGTSPPAFPRLRTQWDLLT
jgi:hypothetical protein